MTLFKKKKTDDEQEDTLPAIATETDVLDNSQDSQDSQDPQDSQSPQDSQDSQDSQDTLDPQDSQDPLKPLLTRLLPELSSGNLSEETRQLLSRALSYDEDILRARAEGELAGRNAAIEEHLLAGDDSDGVPHPGCGQGASQSAQHLSIFDLARGARM